MFKHLIIGAALVFAGASATAEIREERQVVVGLSDLNLASLEGQQALDGRLGGVGSTGLRWPPGLGSRGISQLQRLSLSGASRRAGESKGGDRQGPASGTTSIGTVKGKGVAVQAVAPFSLVLR
jgi:hypothetical protein